MQPLDYSGALDYLIDLGTRHKAIKESRSGVSDPDPNGASLWPLLFIEEDTQADELNPSADVYLFAFQILTKDRHGKATKRELLQLTKRIGDELIAQIRDEGVIVLVEKPNKLSLGGDASDSLATGWRYEVRLHVMSDLDRNAVAAQFEPYSPAQ
ncbi:hypothetical protein [Hymenobacter fodinae]|uniref:Uncharacterized protein n=1 Tax=Hymenobacter fodinae TaxID=2510796 RepID=A0A4Z0P7C7_9BACT|nr:hypothetical protein [Hymenobacter fodinae]TGE08263.1 hypothetical protein EU556_11110 [Hymenobacter fodinae]